MTLKLAVVLIAILSLLNAVGIVALIRQVGVLHLRIAPVAGMPGGAGPEPGTTLALPVSLTDLAGNDAEHFLFGFVSPTCTLCDSLTSAVGRLAQSKTGHVAHVLVLDADEQSAEEYLRSKKLSFLPHVADRATFQANVPGAPWAVVTDRFATVILSAGVNTLDNVEEMITRAESLAARSRPGPNSGSANGEMDGEKEVRENVV